MRTPRHPGRLLAPFPPGGGRSAARDCAKASREVKKAKRGVAEAKGLLDDTRGLVKGGVGHKGMTIAEAIEEASGRATLFRNRLAATTQLADLDKSITRIDSAIVHSIGAEDELSQRIREG